MRACLSRAALAVLLLLPSNARAQTLSLTEPEALSRLSMESPRVRAILELDEGKPSRASRFPIDRQDDLRRRGDRGEIGPEVSFGGGVRQIAHEQTDSQSESPFKTVKYPELICGAGKRESSRDATRWQPILG